MWDKLFPPECFFFLGYVTNSMVRSLFREANSFSVCQEVIRILCNPDVTFITVFTRIRPPLVSTLNCSSQCCCLTSSFLRFILIVFYHPHLGLLSDSFLHHSPPKPHILLSSPCVPFVEPISSSSISSP